VRFRDLDIPASAVAAHRADRLVLFVGAGASMAPPSSLPNFTGLVTRVAADSPEPEIGDRRLDRVLGDLESRHGIDVHARVAQVLRPVTSEPNALHAALCQLALTARTPRVVTTNFDHHLSTAFAAAGQPLREFVGPALPLGDDFHGLVYLHGKLDVDDSSLVLTDRDFGAAYLRDAWATRFLERMFSAYEVLFVGYSHEDLIMDYLARALRGQRSRYLLTDNPGRDNWSRLELQPIGYPLRAGPDAHSALSEGLSAWAEREASGLLGNDARVARLVVSTPPFDPEDEDFLTELVDDRVQVGFLLERIDDPAWWDWLAGKPAFRQLFDRQTTLDQESSPAQLAAWFAARATRDEDESAVALGWYHELGSQMSPLLWWHLALALHRCEGPRPRWLDPWLLHLLDNDPGFDRDLLNYALEKTDWTNGASVGLLLLEHLTRPLVTPSRGLGLSSSYDLTIRGDGYWLNEARITNIRVSMPGLASRLLALTSAQISRGALLRSLYGDTGAAFDPDDYRRTRIDAEATGRYTDPLDPAIDLARDAIRALSDSGADLDFWISSWVNESAPLLRRLAVYGQTVRTDTAPADRIRWLLEHELFTDPRLRPEVQILTQAHIGSVDGTLVDQLVLQVTASDPRCESHLAFTTLSWAHTHGADTPALAEALDAYRRTNPDWEDRGDTEPEPREIDFAEPRPSMLHLDLVNLVDEDVQAAITALRGFRGAGRSFQQPSWGDAAALVRSLAVDHTLRSLRLAEATTGDDGDIREALLYGWAGLGLLEPSVAAALLGVVNGWVESVAPHAITSLLSRRLDNGESNWVPLPQAWDLAVQCWEVLPVEPVSVGGADWLHEAINDPAGHLTLFVMMVLQRRREEAGDTWVGLHGDQRALLNAMLQDSARRGALASVIISSNIRFLAALDSEWTNSQVLPRLDWSRDENDALRNWHGLLTWGWWTEGLLEAGLLSMYNGASERFDQFPERLRHQLALQLASLILRSESVLDRRACARSWTARVDTEVRVAVLRAVGRVLRDAPAPEPDVLWESVIGDYWQDRLNDNPVPLTVSESTALVELLPHFESAFPQALTLALQSPATLHERSHLLHEFTPDLVRRDANRVVELLSNLLEGAPVPAWELHPMREIFAAAQNITDPRQLDRLREALVGSGLLDARHW
jgi:hypothetical protein